MPRPPPDTDPAWGPVTWFDSHRYYYLNDPGCLALDSSDAPTAACARAVQASRGCNLASCQPNCEEDLESGDFASFSTCVESGDTGVCATFYAAVKADCNDLDNTALGACYQANSESDATYFERVMAVFCGGAASDAGPDSAPDAAPDASPDASSDAALDGSFDAATE